MKPCGYYNKRANVPCPKCGQSHTDPVLEPMNPASLLDFESDTPLVCNRDQSGDTTCESCQ